jgi:hypothetical protein
MAAKQNAAGGRGRERKELSAIHDHPHVVSTGGAAPEVRVIPVTGRQG